jgi:hypothetical protein
VVDIGAAFVFVPLLLDSGLLSIQGEGHMEAGHSPLLKEPAQQDELAAPFIQLRATKTLPSFFAFPIICALIFLALFFY